MSLSVRESLTQEFVNELFCHICGCAGLPAATLQIIAQRDEGASAMPEFDHAFAIQFRISLHDSVGADYKFLSQGTDGGQLITRPEDAAFDRVSDLLHQLDVDRNATRRIQSKKPQSHCFIVMIQLYTGVVKRFGSMNPHYRAFCLFFGGFDPGS